MGAPGKTEVRRQMKSGGTESGETIHQKLAKHLGALGMGLPYRAELIEILEANLSQQEAAVALLLPNRVAPLSVVSAADVAARAGVRVEEIEPILEGLTRKHLLFTAPTESGQRGYALHQAGYGFPQVFLWSGEATQHAAHMAGLFAKYSNRQVTAEMFGAAETKPYRYAPPAEALPQGVETVYPYHTMEKVVQEARRFALAHCTCRTAARLLGKGCEHPLEVCMKFNSLADYLIENGLGREITREEAIEVIRKSEEAGLVHFVDNCEGEAVHNCNCCGHACWNVGSIRRRKIPRDLLMATYFMRETVEEDCSSCELCAEVCPVACVTMNEGLPQVDEEWCIGCGVCVHQCPSGAARLRVREDRSLELPKDFDELHERILKEKKLI